MQSAFLRTIASEHRGMFGETARLIAAITDFGDKPLWVITSGKPNPAFGEAAGRFQKYWADQSRALAAKSTRGRAILAEDSAHYLYLEAPELVTETILSAVDAARAP